MAIDFFLKLADIPGESQDEAHKDEIDVKSWGWGMSQSGTTQARGGGGSAKVSVRDLTVTKFVDKSTPVLFMHCCNGKHIKDAQLTCRKAGGDAPVEYLKINMEEVIVADITPGAQTDDEQITENVTLNFARVKVTYTGQAEAGTPEGEIVQGWDIAKNVKWG